MQARAGGAAAGGREGQPGRRCSGRGERDDLLQTARDLRIVQEQKWTDIVENALRQARRELVQDPDAVLDNLRNLLSRVKEHPDLSDRTRNGLSARLQTALRESRGQAQVLKLRKEEINRNAVVARQMLQRDEQAKTLQERQAAQLAVFRQQIELAYQDERAKTDVLNGLLAMQTEARLRNQPMPLTAQSMYEMVQAGYNLERYKDLRKVREDRFLGDDDGPGQVVRALPRRAADRVPQAGDLEAAHRIPQGEVRGLATSPRTRRVATRRSR